MKWAYRIRIEQDSVRVETIENTAKDENGLLHYIDQILHSKEMLSYKVEDLKSKKRVQEVGHICELFGITKE